MFARVANVHTGGLQTHLQTRQVEYQSTRTFTFCRPRHVSAAGSTLEADANENINDAGELVAEAFKFARLTARRVEGRASLDSFNILAMCCALRVEVENLFRICALLAPTL